MGTATRMGEVEGPGNRGLWCVPTVQLTKQRLRSERVVRITDFCDSHRGTSDNAKVQGVTLRVAEGKCRGKVLQLGEARESGEPATLRPKSSRMMAGLGWSTPMSWCQSPQ